ncbi:MAG: helix-turn-helix domain-containing protein [Acidobacteria bacterium]|nr:helix-turn-helix domain-containing protein [Acidobacteriota bacterium]
MIRRVYFLPNKPIILIFLFLLFLKGSLCGLDPLKSIDQYVQEDWNTGNGLPENSVVAVSQTPDGYLWVATRQQLYRFNGIKFISYSLFNDAQAGYKEITALKVDRSGVLWIGTRGNGLFKYKNEIFEIFTQKDGLSGNTINCLYSDLKSNLWIGSDAGSLARLTEKEVTLYGKEDGLYESYIYAIFEDSRGNLWVGTRGDGLYRFTNGRFVKIPLKDSNRCDVTAIKEDSSGGLWIGTNHGLIYYRVDKTEFLAKSQGIFGYSINDIIEDSDGNVWIGTTNGLFRIRKGWSDVSSIQVDESLDGSVVSGIFEDQEKSIWAATDGRGLTRLREGKIKTFSVESGLPHEYVVNMYEDRDQNLWVATMDGLTRFGKGELNSSAMSIEFSDAVVGPICRDREGNTWFGTYGSGLYKLETGGKKRLTNYTTRDGLLSDSIISLHYEDNNIGRGTIWIGTSQGLNAIENGIFKTYNDHVELLKNEISCIYEDNKKNLWIGTNKGLIVRKNGHFLVPELKGLPAGIMISSIFQDKDNNEIYWIAAKGNGLLRFKDENDIFAFTTSYGLYSNTIYQVFEDAGGYMWMSCDKGVFKTAKKDLNDLAVGKFKKQEINYTYYGKSDGMKSEECSRWGQHSSIKTRNGKLLFGTTKGISIILPHDIKINTIPPQVVIERAATNNKDLELNNNRDQFVFKTLEYIQFYFTTSTLISPGRVFFKYKLENYDRDWTIITPAQIKMAIYKKLPPGQYTFRVIAANSDGIWNEKGASFTFTFSPGFTQSVVFKVMLGLVIAFLGIAIFQGSKKYLVYRKTKNKYKDSVLAPQMVEKCMKKLSYVMDIEKIYRDDKLSLQTLSKKVSVTPHILSQVLNERIDKNFADYVNSFRIEEAKILLQEADEDTSVLRVCYEVGFNSKSAFYRAFKKYTDKTPIQYQKDLKKEN